MPSWRDYITGQHGYSACSVRHDVGVKAGRAMALANALALSSLGDKRKHYCADTGGLLKGGFGISPDGFVRVKSSKRRDGTT